MKLKISLSVGDGTLEKPVGEAGLWSQEMQRGQEISATGLQDQM